MQERYQYQPNEQTNKSLQFGPKTLFLTIQNTFDEKPVTNTFVVDLSDTALALRDTLTFASRRNPDLLPQLKKDIYVARDTQTTTTRQRMLLFRVLHVIEDINQSVPTL